jgi:glycine cleavage system aminomethyltransferase T
VQVLCVDGLGNDCTRLIGNAYSLGLGWQSFTDQYNPASQMFVSQAEAAQLASIAAAGPAAEEHLYSLGLQKPDRVLPHLEYLHVAQVEEF